MTRALIVIVPVFNGSRFLSEALTSIQNQTFTDFDVVISDNHSTDSSVAIASDFVASDSRFSIVRTPIHFKLAEDHLSYLLKSKSLWQQYKYLAFRHDDDVLVRSMFAEQMSKLCEHFTAPLCFTGAYVTDELLNIKYQSVSCARNTRYLNSSSLLYSEIDLISGGLLSSVTAFTPSVIIRVESIEGLDLRLDDKTNGKAADFGLWVEIVRISGSAIILPKALFYYRKHLGSDSAVSDKVGLKNCFLDFLSAYMAINVVSFSNSEYSHLARLILMESLYRFAITGRLSSLPMLADRLAKFEGLCKFHFILMGLNPSGFKVLYEVLVASLISFLGNYMPLSVSKKNRALFMFLRPLYLIKSLFASR